MKSFEVCDYQFTYVGVVFAYSAEAALREAKKRWPHIVGLMVEEV